MKTLQGIRATLAQHKSRLERDYHVKYLAVFGSYVRSQHTPSSDLDVLVEFSQPIGFFKFLDLEEDLESLLDVGVDLVSRNALKGTIGQRILEEAVAV